MALILCVDDNADGLAVRKVFLEAFGYQTLIATSGLTAIKLAEQHAIDVVLLEYEMPGMDGEEVAVILKNRWPTLPIIVLTGSCKRIPGCLVKLANKCIDKSESPRVLLSELQQFSKPKAQPRT